MKRLLLIAFMLTRGAWADGPLRLHYDTVGPLALQNNLRLRSSTFQVDAAQARFELSQALRNPTLIVTGIYEHKDANVVRGLLPDPRFLEIARAGGVHAEDLYVGGQNPTFNRAVLTVPVYSGGRLESQMHEQHALLEAARLDHGRARQSIVYQAKLIYLETLLAQDNTLVAQENLAQAQETLRYARSRLHSGVASRYDLLQAQVAVANAQDSLTRTRAVLEKSRGYLAAALGESLDTPLELEDTLLSPAIMRAEAVSDLDVLHLAPLALAQRPELEELRQRLLANHERGGAARAGRLPQLSFNLNYDLLGLPSELRGGMSLVTTLLIPIFDGGLSRAQEAEVASLRLRLGEEQLRAAQEIVRQTIVAALEVSEADSRLERARAARRRADEAARIASLRFQVGAGTALELVSAQSILADTEFALMRARQRQLAARVSLNFALGQMPKGES